MLKPVGKTDYNLQAADFLSKTRATLTVEFDHNGKHFDDDKINRDIYNITLTRGKRSYTFKFGQSVNHSGKFQKIINKGKFQERILETSDTWQGNQNDYWYSHQPVKPSAYDVLSCLTKYDPGIFTDFCADFGYDEDSRKAYRAYGAVRDEYLNLAKLFNDAELEEMAEIQ